MKKKIVFISIGSNMGDKYTNCINGIEHIKKFDKTKIIDVANFYKTEPVDYKDQDWFINSILKIETEIEPEILMLNLTDVEQKLGQYEKKIRFGPRIIDLDIIFYESMVINTEKLTVPHPRMNKRCFVLKPLCDIAPEIIHPILGCSVIELLKEVEHDQEQRISLFCETKNSFLEQI